LTSQRKVDQPIWVPEKILVKLKKDRVQAEMSISKEMIEEVLQETSIENIEKIIIKNEPLQESMVATTKIPTLAMNVKIAKKPTDHVINVNQNVISLKKKEEELTFQDMVHLPEAVREDEEPEYHMLEVVVDHSSTIERDHSSITIVMRNPEVNGKIIKMIKVEEKISKDLKDQATILATDNSEWTNLGINPLKSSTTVLPTKSKKRGTKGSTKEIKEIDLLKSNSIKDEQ
jgi:hypothetical protein